MSHRPHWDPSRPPGVRHRRAQGLFLLGLIAAGLALAPTAARPDTKPSDLGLPQVLTLMDKFGQSLRTLSARIAQKKYVAVLREFDPEERGLFYYDRRAGGPARLRKEIAEPAPNIITIDKGIVIAYEPRIKQARRIDLGKNKDKAEFLAIGIGQDPKKLEETFHMKVLGMETLEGQKTYLLELRPKSTKVGAFFSAIVLWLDAARGIPVQQKFIEPNGDYILVRFTEVKINPKLAPGLFELKLPKDVQMLQ